MASPTYQCSDLRHVVFHRLEPESPSPTPNSIQDVEVTITLQLDLKRHYCLTNQFIDLDEEGPLFFQETLRFDLRVLSNPYRASLILGPVLRRHYITHNSPSYDAIIDDIIRHGRRIGNWKSNKGRPVLPLLVEISGTLVQHVNYEEDEGLIGRALEESASELETSNYNMVPAKASSVKKMLKRVRVEGGDRDGENIKKRRIELTFFILLRRTRHYRLIDHLVDLDDDYSLFSQETMRFDLDVLQSYDRTYQILAPMLVRLKVNPNARRPRAIIDEIIRQGCSVETSESNKESQVWPLHAMLWVTIVQHVNEEEEEEEEDLIERALEESASEFESSNYNMVPAKESSIKNMLKSVRVEAVECDQKGEERIMERLLETENCVICLEELKVGSDASRMPCSHTFHGDCIEEWLKQSHYCPICRFEMPTE
ncbi:zinc finger protein [Theobroma cacao]|nr:zinc finger protein [Theobroma cacao]